MAKTEKTIETPAETPAETTDTAKASHPAKGQPRIVAAVTAINYSDSLDEDDIMAVAGVRSSPWAKLLDNLYDDTAAEDSMVPRDENGKLRFVKLGTFRNAGGARTQVKAFEDKHLNDTFEFKTVVKGGESTLWARVIETMPDTASVEG